MPECARHSHPPAPDAKRALTRARAFRGRALLEQGHYPYAASLYFFDQYPIMCRFRLEGLLQEDLVPVIF